MPGAKNTRNIATVLMDTWTDAFIYKPAQNMNSYVRWELFIFGCVLLGITMDVSTQLQWLVLLPLLSIYLIQSAITGYEPIYFLLRRLGIYLHKHPLIPKLHIIAPRRTAVVK